MCAINKKLFDELFIKSHQKLAIKSLQILNDCENMLISKSLDNNYHLIKIKEVFVSIFGCE